MKISSFYLLALFTPLGLQAAPITFPGSTVTATSPSVPGVLNINTTSIGADSGSYHADAGGSLGLNIGVGSATLQTQTQITGSQINFQTITTSSGTLGGLVGPIVTTGVVPTWEASIDLTETTLGLNLQPSTQYALTFNMAQNGLLGNLSLPVLNSYYASVGDSDSTFSAGLLGLTNLTSSTGTVTLNFTTDSTITGPITAKFGASAVLNASLVPGLLVAPNTTLYSITVPAINPIPEPSTWALSAIFAGSMMLRRRR